ncbi:MAG TPA: amidohydrolase family protein [Vicinamibacterales bacterium]|nr:amidohydrolase family protein [Vicinamibacterales bacterium]
MIRTPASAAVVAFVAACLVPASAHQDQKPGDQKPDQKKWDVAAPLGPTTSISFETTEGTWMNADVSPDGRQIAFDLLGDIYVMPIEGAPSGAKRITSGAVFDMQPRFSPDGRRIAFASDRDGLWNIWTTDVEGKDARQISRERRWFVNSPAWSPDGTYIYARRHFVKERSLGAGEIWMYHSAGPGDGLQVTERNGWQKDAGEPEISPDGRYLYYSRDVTPGQTFEYNKDPNGTIYAIMRRDLVTGRERRAVSVQGGSVRPEVSPDGKTLAYIRRVRLESYLYLRDLESGRDRQLFGNVDKDLQEAWAIHGLYPQYSWTPDGKSIVIWGEGRFWRVDVATGKGEQIPFQARVEQTLNDAVRFPQTVHPERFPVKMLRDVRVSPDGRLVAYSALGHLYVRPLPDGEPRRLTGRTVETTTSGGNGNGNGAAQAAPAPPGTRAGDTYEFYPAFSRDGQWIVYTTWNDEQHGRVRVIRPDGSGGRDVVERPGHYVEPSFSPDGRTIVFRDAGGDSTRGRYYASEPGIYVVAVEGGEPVLARDSGTEPEFDHTGTRIYVRETRNEKSTLFSVGVPAGPMPLPGRDEIEHVRSDNATQFAPSPDGKWLAFEERFRTFIAPFPRTGRPVDIGPSTQAYPVQRVSRDAGFYLHWSGDGRRLHWTLGPELFTRDLADTFAFAAAPGGGAAAGAGPETAKPEEPEASGIQIGFTAASDVPAGSIALVGARVITMAGLKPGPVKGAPGVVENATIVIEGNRIAAIGPSSSISVPAGARRVDVRGKTIMPGIIDVHAHVGGESSGLLTQSSWPLAANVAFGVTTSHDPSNDSETVFTNAELIRAGAKLGPRLFSTGRILYGAETPFKAVVESYDDALSHLRRQKAMGAISVKSYNQQRRDARQMLVKAARETEMLNVPEGGSLLYMNQTHVIDGHTGVEHSLPVPRIYKDTVELFARSGVGYTPTLIVGYGGLSGEFYWYQHTNVWENERLLSFVPREIVDARSRRRTMAPENDFNHVLIARGAKQIADAGGSVQLGAHGQLQGLGAHWELWMLQQGGMTPMEALRAATIDGARYLGMEADLGSLEKGKLADLVVLDRNPLENVRHTEAIGMVMLNGRLYDRNLAEIGNHPAPAPTFWFTR